MSTTFVSYASSDRRQALALCDALERRGIRCWIACRDVQLGENYQEAIVRAIREAHALVLIFSHHANTSEEIKKELSLASRHRIAVMATRIEDVEPSDAFAYELATRQWIDLFTDRDAAIATLARRIAEVAPRGDASLAPPPAPQGPASFRWRQLPILGACICLLFGLTLAAWLMLHQNPSAPKSMTVRLIAFNRLSSDVPVALADGLRDEIAAAFSNDGLIKVSTAAAPPPGTAAAYALGGTVRRDGDTIRVAAQLTNERSGAALWSNSFTYPAAQADAAPRRFAIDTGNLVRCGLFGASTYPKSLPDAVLSDYLQVCHYSGLIEDGPTKALDFARRVIAAAPDFSWGWSGIAASAAIALVNQQDLGTPDALRQEGLAAATAALKLDPRNSEALARQAQLLDQNDLVGRDALLRRAIAARPLACGCEHDFYGDFLEEVGREKAALGEFQRAVDVWALNAQAQESLANALAQNGQTAAAMTHLDAAIELGGDPSRRDIFTVSLAPVTHDYAAAITTLSRPSHLPTDVRNAWISAFRALAEKSPSARAAAIANLNRLTPIHGGRAATTAHLLGALGDSAGALRILDSELNTSGFGRRSWLFYPSMRSAWYDPAFASLADRFGLVGYWRTTHSRPDLCGSTPEPPVCQLL
jgi:TolB-like protein